VESFNGRLRQECLNAHWFLLLEDARTKIEAWRKDYNENRPQLRAWLGSTRRIRPPLPVATGSGDP
jgi:transposase InsO family protein